MRVYPYTAYIHKHYQHPMQWYYKQYTHYTQEWSYKQIEKIRANFKEPQTFIRSRKHS